jgi:hypothetical protein
MSEPKVRTQAELRPHLDSLLQSCKEDPRYVQLMDLLDFLDQKSCFWMAPASGGYHNAFIGGLADHSIKVAETAMKLRNLLAPELPAFSVIVCGLFHDLGKIGAITDHNEPLYVDNLLKSGDRSDAKPFKHNDQLMSMDQGTRTLRIVEKFIDLKEAEAQTLRYDDGLYVPENRTVWQTHHYTPLLLLVAFADNWQGIIVEDPEKHPITEHLGAPFSLKDWHMRSR